MKTQYSVVIVQIVGNLEEWQLSYSTDGKRCQTRQSAIKHGWRLHDHDDWLLAHLEGNRLVMTSWQYEDRPDETEERREMAEQCGWVSA